MPERIHQNPTASLISYWELGSQDPPQFPGLDMLLNLLLLPHYDFGREPQLQTGEIFVRSRQQWLRTNNFAVHSHY